MSCKVQPGCLRTGERAAGANKKRVHFSDEWPPVTHRTDDNECGATAVYSQENARIGLPMDAKSCCFMDKGPGLVEEFAKASITCGIKDCATAVDDRLSEAKPRDKIYNAEDEKVNSAVAQSNGSACNGPEFISHESPCTLPSGGGYGLAVFDNGNFNHPNSRIHKVQRKLTFINVVQAGDQKGRKNCGLTNKKPLSRVQSYKVAPQSEAAFLTALVTPPRLIDGVYTFGSSEGACKKRCAWITPNSGTVYVAYHDEEWGVPVHDDRRLFELLVFAGAQAEMAWSSLLTKRDAYRDAFGQFDPAILATYDVTAMVASQKPQRGDVMKSETRVQSIVTNAKVVMKIVEEFGSFSEYLWRFVSYKPIVGKFKQAKSIPTRTAKSEAISKDLQRRGMRHAGPMVVYSFMQAAGLANDHLLSCFRHPDSYSSAPSSASPVSLISSPSTKPLISPLCC